MRPGMIPHWTTLSGEWNDFCNWLYVGTKGRGGSGKFRELCWEVCIVNRQFLSIPFSPSIVWLTVILPIDLTNCHRLNGVSWYNIHICRIRIERNRNKKKWTELNWSEHEMNINKLWTFNIFKVLVFSFSIFYFGFVSFRLLPFFIRLLESFFILKT